MKSHPVAGRWTIRMGPRSGWALGPAAIVAGLVIAVPLILLTLAALVAGLTVFFILVLIGRAIGLVKSGWRALTGSSSQPGDVPSDGRHNVRVIHR